MDKLREHKFGDYINKIDELKKGGTASALGGILKYDEKNINETFFKGKKRGKQ